MCEMNAYVIDGGGGGDAEELYLESVETLRPEADGSIYLKSLFGEEKRFRGRLLEISFRENKVLLKK